VSQPTELWDPEKGRLCFGILALDKESRLILFVKKIAREWMRENLGEEAGDAADRGEIQITLVELVDFKKAVVAEELWVLDYVMLSDY
jgi:hypothetical protein